MKNIENIELIAKEREFSGKKVDKIRKTGKIPAVIYGHGVENKNLEVDYKDFEKLYKAVGSSQLVDLKINGNELVKVLIQEVQQDPVTDRFIHVDFHQVRMTEKVTASVALKYVGESKAVKEFGGVLVKSLDSVEIECLPQDLIQEIEVDISPLKTFDDIIRIKDLKTPSGVEIKDKGEIVVANVQPPRSEEELKSLEETPEEKAGEVEVAGKEKGESEAGEQQGKESEGKKDESAPKAAGKAA